MPDTEIDNRLHHWLGQHLFKNFVTFFRRVTIAGGGLSLTGTARVKREIFVPVGRLVAASGSATNATHAVGASGSITIPVLRFSASTPQDTSFCVHVPPDCDGSVNLDFHLMWLVGAGWSAGENFMWKLDYIVTDENGVSSDIVNPTTIYASVIPGDITDNIETTNFNATIDAGPDQEIWCRLWRDTDNDNSGGTGDVKFCEFEYTANKLGETT